MAIDATLVRHVAGLANLAVSVDEVAYFQTHLSRILDYVAQLDALPASPEADRVDLAFVPDPYERADILKPSLDPKVALVNAAVTAGSTFQVPRIIE